MPPALALPLLPALARLLPDFVFAVTRLPPRLLEREMTLLLFAVTPPAMLLVAPLTVGLFVPPEAVWELVALPPVLLLAIWACASVLVPAASSAAPNDAAIAFFAFMNIFLAFSCRLEVNLDATGLGAAAVGGVGLVAPRLRVGRDLGAAPVLGTVDHAAAVRGDTAGDAVGRTRHRRGVAATGRRLRVAGGAATVAARNLGERCAGGASSQDRGAHRRHDRLPHVLHGLLLAF